jgi:predicted DNA-binding transcriptional regulator YafY
MAIDQAVRAGRLPTTKKLSEELGDGRRTIGRDIEFMKDQLRAPIKFDFVRNGFVYTDPTYHLPCFQMSEGELLALYLVERMMEPLRGTPFEADLRRAILKLKELLPDGVSIRVDEIADLLSVLPASQPLYNPECFRALTSAVVCRRRVEMVYWTASRNETKRRDFDPYNLALIEDGWYAVGYCHSRRDILMFAVQRIRSMRTTTETFDRPADFRLDEYLARSFRAFRGDEDHTVVLRFSPDLARRIGERHWHPSQSEETERDGSLVLRFQVSDLREVKRWVMGWGADCRVVEPKELRESILDEAKRMLENEANPVRGRRGSRSGKAKTSQIGEHPCR